MRIARIILEKKSCKALPALPDIKIHYKASKINTLIWQWSIDKPERFKSTDYQINLANDKGGIFYHPSKFFFLINSVGKTEKPFRKTLNWAHISSYVKE